VQLLDIGAKRLEFLVTAVPEAKRVGALFDASSPTAEELGEIEAGARSLNVEIIPTDVRALKILNRRSGRWQSKARRR